MGWAFGRALKTWVHALAPFAQPAQPTLASKHCTYLINAAARGVPAAARPLCSAARLPFFSHIGFPRRGAARAMSRPEHQAPPELYYDERWVLTC